MQNFTSNAYVNLHDFRVIPFFANKIGKESKRGKLTLFFTVCINRKKDCHRAPIWLVAVCGISWRLGTVPSTTLSVLEAEVATWKRGGCS